MKGGASICQKKQKADRLALWLLVIWQKYPLQIQKKTVFKDKDTCAMVLQNCKTLFHTLIYMMLFKTLLQMAGKALHIKQSGNSSTQKLKTALR